MTVILDHLRQISAEAKLIPQILARLDSLAEEQSRLQKRDDEQQQLIDDLRFKCSEFGASVSILSTDVHDATRDVKDLRADFSTFKEGRTAILSEWEPWLKGLRWTVRIIGAALVVALAGALIWALSESGAGLP